MEPLRESRSRPLARLILMALCLTVTVGGGISNFKQSQLEEAVLLGIDGSAAGGASWDDQLLCGVRFRASARRPGGQMGAIQTADLQLVPMAFQLTEEPELPLDDEIKRGP